MTLVIGTDEAGYGPNLGPLVVAASAWRIAGARGDPETAFAAAGPFTGEAGRGPLWADSKTVYRAGAGFAALERGVQAALALARTPARDWQELAAALGTIGPEPGADRGWATLDSLALPRMAPPEACREAAAEAGAALAAAGLTLVGIVCRAIYPTEFNRLLDRGLNKSDILSRTTLDLAAGLRDRFGPGDAVVWCDRHGGRRSYAPLVARHFSVPLVQPLEETALRSVYSAPTAGLRIEFAVGGEARLPVALASMTAKYVRELAMAAFNDFWSARLPGLAPTAGYPVDARRWRIDAAPALDAAGIPAADLWRRV